MPTDNILMRVDWKVYLDLDFTDISPCFRQRWLLLDPRTIIMTFLGFGYFRPIYRMSPNAWAIPSPLF